MFAVAEQKLAQRSLPAAHKPAWQPPAVSPFSLPQPKGECACGGGCPSCEKRGRVQTKLEVSTPGDQFEQEADRVADQIMRMPDAKIQRKLSSAAESSDDVSAGIDLGRGQPLNAETRAFFEPRFGADFSRVRVHAGAGANESAQALNALAYTTGHDVVFGRGQYQPETAAGRRLLAHELTHVLQQRRTSDGSLVQRQTAHSPEPNSVIDSRIDVRAQFALLRLFKREPPDSTDAVDLLNDVKSGKIKGIFGDDLARAAILAGERGKHRWELVPKGEDAIMLDDEFDDTPVLVFKESAGQRPRLDEALLAVYRSHRAKPSSTPKTAPPPFKLPTIPRPAPGTPSKAPCAFTVDATLMSDGPCSSPLCGAVQQWKYNRVNVVPPCTFDFNANDQLIEVVSSDGKCTGQSVPKTGFCPIAPNGSLGRCTDSYGVCKPPDQIQFGGQTTCTETMNQQMFIGGSLTNSFLVESHQIIFTFTKSGTGCSATAVRK